LVFPLFDEFDYNLAMLTNNFYEWALYCRAL